MGNKEKNGFLITWGTCLVILLTLCYFGVRGTYSAAVPAPDWGGGSTDSGSTGSGSSGSSGSSCDYGSYGECMGAAGSGYTCEYSGGCYVVVPGEDKPSSGSGSGSSGSSGSSCDYGSYGECMGAAGTGKTCVYQNGCYVVVKGNDVDCQYGSMGECLGAGLKNCYEASNGCFYGEKVSSGDRHTCSTGTYYSSLGSAISSATSQCGNGKYNITQEYDQGCYSIECCDCQEDGTCDKSYSACWSTGSSYVWGSSTVYGSGGKGYSEVSSSNCLNSSGSTGNGGSTNPSNPGDPGEPSNPSNPSNPNNPDEPSNPSNPDNPSNSGNVTTNPATGQIMMFVMWVIGFAALGYSVWYLLRSKESN